MTEKDATQQVALVLLTFSCCRGNECGINHIKARSDSLAIKAYFLAGFRNCLTGRLPQMKSYHKNSRIAIKKQKIIVAEV